MSDDDTADSGRQTWFEPPCVVQIEPDGRRRHRWRAAGFDLDVVLEQGGKIDQLTGSGGPWLSAGRSWARMPTADSGFVAAGVSGWDEMVPTISPGVLDGRRYPDHGDAWRQPWTAETANRHGFDSRSWNYSLRRSIRTDGHKLRLDYQLTSTVAQPLLWAAHPLFLAPPGSRVTLPATVSHVQDIGEQGNERLVAWTPGTASIDSVPPGEYRKYVVPLGVAVDRARLVHSDGRWLELTWPTEVVRYLAIFFDNGAFSPVPVIAIEPMTGWYDSVDRAVRSGTADRFAPNISRTWWIDLTEWTPSL